MSLFCSNLIWVGLNQYFCYNLIVPRRRTSFHENMTLILNYTDEADVIYIFLHAMSSCPETKFLPIYLGTYFTYFSTDQLSSTSTTMQKTFNCHWEVSCLNVLPCSESDMARASVSKSAHLKRAARVCLLRIRGFPWQQVFWSSLCETCTLSCHILQNGHSTGSLWFAPWTANEKVSFKRTNHVHVRTCKQKHLTCEKFCKIFPLPMDTGSLL